MLNPQHCLLAAGLSADEFKVEPCLLGLSHRHYRLESASQTLFLRIYGDSPRPWLDPQHELTLLQQAAAIGLAPQLVYLDPQQRFFISEYIEHQPKSQFDCEDLLRLIERFQKLPVSRTMVLAERFALYWQSALALQPEWAQRSEVVRLHQQTQQAIQQLANSAMGKSFIDWHQYNVLESATQTYLIDYEYACLTPLALELASLKCSELVAEHQWLAFQRGFEQLHGVKVSPAELAAAEFVYLSFCYVWYPANDLSDATEQQRLLQLLKQTPFANSLKI